jgi:hypothetical protein
MLHRISSSTGFICLLFLVLSCSRQNEKAENQRKGAKLVKADLTFRSDVAPIVFENCTPCHHADGAAPFPFTTFEDVKKRTKTIRWAVADGYMPPWPADPSYRRFKDEKVLDAEEKSTLLAWIEQGAPEGDKSIPLPEPNLSDSPGLGDPDLILNFPDTILIEGDNRDRFRIAKIALNLPRDTIIEAIHFVPGNRQLVHHVNGHLVNYQSGLKRTLNDGEWIVDAETMNSLEAYRRMKIAQDDGTYPALRISAFNYLPGVEPVAYPDGMGGLFVNRKAALLLNTLHYGPSARDTFDFSRIEIYFAEGAPERPIKELHMGTQGITPVEPEFIIPAGEVTTFTTEYRVPETMSVLTVNPHMHLLGTKFEAFARSADGRDTIPLIIIPQWDFRWQYFYTYEEVVVIPKGYTIKVIATFDNTLNNPFNPHSPPKTLREAGKNMRTTDEMFQFFVNYVDYQEGDESIRL